MAKTLLQQTQERLKNNTLNQREQEGIKAYEAKYGTGSVQKKLGSVKLPQIEQKKAEPIQEEKAQTGTMGTTGTGGVIPKSSVQSFSETPQGGVTTENRKIYAETGTNIPPVEETTKPQDDFITQVDELSDAEKTVYDMLSDAEKEQFEAIGENARKAGQDYVKAQAEYLAEVNQTKTRLEEDEESRLRIKKFTDEIGDIQSSQRIEAAQKQVENIKQNIAYLGNMGMPGTSAQRVGALDAQIQDAEKTLIRVKNIENLMNLAEQEGEDSRVRQFERQLEDLQQDLDKKLDDVIQNSLGELSRAEILQTLESEEDVENLRVQLLNDLDEQITGITDANIQQRKFLIDRYDQYAERQNQYIQNKSVINKDMSIAQGFYVDGNGNPLISADTGQRINIPPVVPIEPFFNEATGKLVTFTQDENGNISADVQQIIEQPKFSEGIINGIAAAVKNGTLSLADVQKIYPGLETNETIANAVAQSKTSTQDWSKLDDNTLYNERTGEIKNADGSTGNVSTDNANAIANFSIQRRGTEYLQCGMLVNDYILKTTGVNPSVRFGDDLDSKIRALQNIGVSETPIAGGVFVSNPLGNDVGHVGIVQKVNPDGSVEVIEANAEGKIEGQPPVTKTYTQEEIQASGMVFSQAVKPEITDREQAQFKLAEGMTGNAKIDFLKEEGLYDKYLQQQEEIAATKDKYQEYVNEYNSTLKLGAGISEKDAELIMEEFNNAVLNDDVEGMKTAIYRGVISKNDDVKPVFDAYKTTLRNLNDIQESYNRYIEKGGKTNIFNGSIEKINQRIGNTTDPDLAAIQAGLSGLLATYIKDTSGTGVSDTERQFISSMLPSIQNVKSLNDVLSKTFIKRIRNGAEEPVKSIVQSDKIYDEVFADEFLLKDVNGITRTKKDIEGGKSVEDPLNIMGNSSESDPLGIMQ